MQKITINIDPDGTVKIDATGFEGKACEDFTRDLENALGDVEKREHKPEYRVAATKAKPHTRTR